MGNEKRRAFLQWMAIQMGAVFGGKSAQDFLRLLFGIRYREAQEPKR